MSSNGGAYNAGTAHVNIKPKFNGFAAQLRVELAKINVEHGINIRANTASLAGELRAAIATLPNDHEIKLGADTTSAVRQIEEAARRRRSTIGANADTARASKEIDKASRDRRSKITIDADTAGANRAIAELTGKIRGLDRYQRRIVMVGSGFTLLGTAAAGAIGPVSALVSVIGSAAGAMATLPAILGGAAAGFAGMKIGMSGIGGAFSAMGKSAGGGGGSTEKAMRSAERAVESARRSIVDAERDISMAHRGIRDSERDLAESQEDSRDAQEELNKAREDAVDNLRDMNEQLRDAALDEEAAVLAVARAQQRLREAQSDGKSSQLDIAEADLNARQAINRLEDVRQENNELAESVAETNRLGVEGSEEVVDAVENLSDARWDEMKASEALEDAHYGLHKAEQGLADAHRDLADALSDMGDAAIGAAGGVDPFAEALAKLSPNAREFVLAMQALSDEWNALKMSTQDALFEGMGEAVTTLANRQLPVLSAGLTDINTAFNRGLRTSIAEFSTEVAALDFEAFLGNTATGFDNLADSAQPLSRIWMDLSTVGSEYLPRIGDSISESMAKWSASVQTARHSGGLNEMIDEGIESAKLLGTDIGHLGGIIAGVYGAARDAGNPFSDNIRIAIADTHEWMDTLEGQTVMRDFFGEATEAVGATLPVLKSLVKGIMEGLVPAVSGFVKGVAPGLTVFIDQLSDNIQIATPAFSELGGAVGGIAADLAGFLDVTEPLAEAVGFLAEGFLSLPTPILAVMGLMAVNKWSKIGGAVGGVRTHVSKFSEAIDEQAILAERSGESISRMTATWRAAEGKSSAFGRMRTSFDRAGTGLRDMGVESYLAGTKMDGFRGTMTRAQGRVGIFAGSLSGPLAGAMSGVKSGAGKVMDYFGGPWALGIGAAVAVIGGFVESHRKAEEAQDNLKVSLADGEQAQYDLAAAVAGTNGELGEDGMAAAARIAKGELAELVEMGEIYTEKFASVSSDVGLFDRLTSPDAANQWLEDVDSMKAIRAEYEVLEEVTDRMGLTMESVNGIVAEGGDAYAELHGELTGAGDAGGAMAARLEEAREKIEAVRESAMRLSPEVAAADAIFHDLANSTGDAGDRAEKLRTAFMELSGVSMTAQEASAKLTEEVARVDDKIRQAAEGTNEFAGAIVDAEGNIDTTTTAGAALWREIDSIGSSMQNSVGAGEDANEVYERMRPTLEALMDTAGLGTDEIAALTEQMMLTPEKMTTVASLDGTSEVGMKLAGLQFMFDEYKGEPITKEMKVEDAEARAQIEAFGFDISNLDHETGVFDVTVNDAWATHRIGWWVDEGMPALDELDAEALLQLDDSGFMLTVEGAKFQLMLLDTDRPNPLANMNIDLLEDEAKEALRQVNLLDGETPTPDASLEISKLTKEQQVALARIFDLDEEEPTPIADMDKRKLDDKVDKSNKAVDTLDREVETRLTANNDDLVNKTKDSIGWLEKLGNMIKNVFSGGDDDAPGNAKGGVIQKLASGGRANRHGGYRLPTSGPGTEVTDGFTALDALGKPIARVDAGEWVINGKSSKKYHSELAAINAGTFPKGDVQGGGHHYATGGVAGLPAYATGGIVQGGVSMTTGIQRSMWDIIRTRFPDAQLSSGTRDWGTTSYHDRGLAIDLGGGWANDLQAIATWINQNFPHSNELFWDPGPNRKNGQPTGAIGGHSDHVHWAMDKHPVPAGQIGTDVKNAARNGTVSASVSGLDGMSLHGLESADLEGSNDSLAPLMDFRQSDASDPNSYSTVRGDDLPTTWAGLATSVATPIIEGQVNDVLGVLGLGNDLPGALQAYQMYDQAINGPRTPSYISDAAHKYLPNANVPVDSSIDDILTQSKALDGWEINTTIGTGGYDPLATVKSYTNTYDPTKGAEQWRGTARMALRRHGYMDDTYLDAMVQQIDIESSGDPDVVNKWDSNWLKGTPSAGLLQVIEPTYRDVRNKYPEPFKGLADSRTAPLTNLVAGIGALKRDWGGPEGGRWPTRDGYADGGDVWGAGGPRDDLIPAWLSNGEHVTKYASASVARPLLNAMNDNPMLAASLNRSYVSAGSAPAPAGPPVQIHYHIETNNVDEGMRRARMQAAREVAAMSVR